MTLRLLPFESDELIRVALEGALSLPAADDGGDPFEKLLGPRAFGRRILLDMRHSRGIDTSGIAWLARSSERFARSGGCLVLHAVPPALSNIARILGLSRQLAAARTEGEAKALALADRPGGIA